MIRDYFRFPQRQDTRSRQDFDEHQQEHGQPSSRRARENIDWDRQPDPEGMRGSPRAAHRGHASGPSHSGDYFEEGYGYGDAYFAADDQRAAHPRFQRGWEGNYRSAPWRLGADYVAPGLHGPYGRSQQAYDTGPDTWLSDEDFRGVSRESAYLKDDLHRRGPHQRGIHRGVGPQSYTRTDERIRDDVCDQLTDHPEVDARYIDVAVENGVVMLQGTVPERAMKYGAEDCSWHVHGVKDVDNRVRVDRTQEARRLHDTNQ